MASGNRKSDVHAIPFGLLWFLSGSLWTVLLFAAINALSYFYRSDFLGDLFGARPGNDEAIGFPFLIWSEAGFSRSALPDSQALVQNVLLGLAVSLPGGLLWLFLFNNRLTNSIIRLSIRKHYEKLSQQIRLQFSLRSLLLLTTVVAVVMAGAKGSVPLRRILLGVIYLGGPWIIVFVSWQSRRLVVWHRRFVVYGTLLLLLVGAFALGMSLTGIDDITRVFLGIFVFWVPQCVFGAIVPIALVRLGYCRRRGY